MKYLKPWWSDGGGLLHLTILLSLAGLRVDLDWDPDLDLCLLLRDEPPLGSGRASPAHALSPFPAWGDWGRADPWPPKGREADPAALSEGRLLREVRALGSPFIPRTRVDAWLVHAVAAGDSDGAGGLLGAAAASSAGGVGAPADGGGQAAPGVSGDLRAARSSPLAAGGVHSEPAEPAAQVPDTSGPANEENEILQERHEAMDHSSQHEENEQRISAQKDKSLQQKNEDGEKVDRLDWEGEKTSESRNERHLNGTDTSLPFSDLLQLLSSQPGSSMEVISPGDASLLGSNDGINFSIHNVNFSQAVSHDEDMLLCPIDNTVRRDLLRTSQPQEQFLQLNSQTHPQQTLPETDLTGSFPFVDNQMRNLTNQELCDLNIDLMSFAIEEGFDPVEFSQLFELDSDPEFSLPSSNNSTSDIMPNSSICEGGIGCNGPESLSYHGLEGAVGGYYPEPSKAHHTDQSDSSFHEDLTFQHILHNHTYHLSTLESTSESLSWTGKSQKPWSKYFSDSDRNLSHDEQRVKALHIPFSIDDIVRMPVDSFNTMLSRSYLTGPQKALIRGIRRRGKNKVAAKNCRKRKLDTILNLEDDVCNLQAKKESLESEQAHYTKAINIMRQKLHDLYHDVFSRLRDEEGRPVNPNQYALQCSQDGSVLIVPKELVASGHKKEQSNGKEKKMRK